VASVSASCRCRQGSLTLEVGIKLRLFDTAHSHLSGWALLLMVLDPTHTWPVVGIHVGSEKTVGYNGVDDEGGRVDVMAVSELEHNEEGHTLPRLMSRFCWFCVVSLQKKKLGATCVPSFSLRQYSSSWWLSSCAQGIVR